MLSLRSAAFTGLVACLMAAPATAQVTPEQVWAQWQDLAGGMGYQMSATGQRREGDTLVLDGVLTAMVSDTVTARAPLGQVRMRDRGDGTVEVTLEPRFEVATSIAEPERDPVEMTMTVTQQAYAMIVSGTPETPRYDVTADAVTIQMAAPSVDGQQMPMDMGLALTGVSGSTVMNRGATTGIVYDVAAEGMTLSMAADNPEGEGKFDLSVVAQALAARFDGTMPGQMAPGAPLGEALAAGLQGTGGYAAGAMEFTFDLTDAESSVAASGTAAGSSLDFGLGQGGMSYQGGVTEMAITAETSDFPLGPMTLSAGEYTFGFGMPLVPTAEPADFNLLMRVVDLVLPDLAWAMLDPTGQLPRDPATLVLDASGKATLFRDLTAIDPTAEQAEDATPPGQIEALNIDTLTLRAAGAELGGTGAFTFDNTDTTTFPGMPRPVGAADLTLTGGNALLDRLIAAGLLPQDQVMAARMMMALFTRPGAGPDTLTSRIEVTPDAQILANGQRIQ